MIDSSNGDDAISRSVLVGARVRFSPTGATIREQAIVRIVEQNLACQPEDKALTENEVCHVVCFAGHVTVLRDVDAREGLRILSANGRVVKSKDGGQDVFALSPLAREEANRVYADCESRNKAIINKLFRNTQGGAQAYALAFHRVLADVFSSLSGAYVEAISQSGRTSTLADHGLLQGAINAAIVTYEPPDARAFAAGVKQFFREPEPDFEKLKWRMAQNYYVMKALGSDTSADLLSVALLQNASLYCDTNVLIAAMVPDCRHHSSFQELLRSCKTLGMTACAAFITVQELRAVVNAHGVLLRRVADRIPDETRSKVGGFLYLSYLAALENNPEITVESFLSGLNLDIKNIEDSLSVSMVDDAAFIRIADDPATERLAEDLVRQYERARRGRPKSMNAAVHDAQLIVFVRNENVAGRKSWIVTLDTSLASWRAGRDDEACRVITLDALLQWLAPVVAGVADEDRLAELFSESLRYQILPSDVFFRLDDFRVFADMEIETRQLPAEDVEECIREVQLAGPNLDPSRAVDREKIGRIIQRHFADPGTKYKQRLGELEAGVADLSKLLGKERELREAAEASARLQEERSDELASKLAAETQARAADAGRLRATDERLAAVEKQIIDEKQRKRLKRTICVRGGLCVLIFLVLLGAIITLSSRYQEGANLLQKLTKSWPFVLACTAVTLTLWRLWSKSARAELAKIGEAYNAMHSDGNSAALHSRR